MNFLKKSIWVLDLVTIFADYRYAQLNLNMIDFRFLNPSLLPSFLVCKYLLWQGRVQSQVTNRWQVSRSGYLWGCIWRTPCRLCTTWCCTGSRPSPGSCRGERGPDPPRPAEGHHQHPGEWQHCASLRQKRSLEGPGWNCVRGADMQQS